MTRIWSALALSMPAALALAQAKKTGNPEDNPRPPILRLTRFGERAVWSPDSRRIAFKSHRIMECPSLGEGCDSRRRAERYRHRRFGRTSDRVRHAAAAAESILYYPPRRFGRSGYGVRRMDGAENPHAPEAAGALENVNGPHSMH